MNELSRFLFRVRRRLSIELFNKNIYDGKLHIYLTLRCNYNCPYCVDNYNKSDFDGYGFKLRSPDEWASKINSLQRDVIFTGGEPFLYKVDGRNLVNLVNQIAPGIRIDIYSNIGLDITDQLSALKRRVNLMVSFHPFEAKLEIFLKNVDWMLHNRKHVTFTIHAVDALDNLSHPSIPRFREEMKDRSIRPTVDVDQGFEGSSRAFKKRATCTRSIVLLAPDGTRFQCVGKLTRRSDHLENIFEQPLAPDRVRIKCREYGFCAPCDWLGDTHIEVHDHTTNIPGTRDHIHKTKSIHEITLLKQPPALPPPLDAK